MKWTRKAAALIAVLGVATAASSPAWSANQCKKQCDAKAQACSKGKADTTPCTKAWQQCKKACAPAKPSGAAPAGSAKK